MTKQEAAALLRDATSGNLDAITSVYGALATIADLLDPPRDGLVEVTVLIGWSCDGAWWDARGFGPKHAASWDQGEAEGKLENAGKRRGWTTIRAWVAPPNLRVAEVEGEVEG